MDRLALHARACAGLLRRRFVANVAFLTVAGALAARGGGAGLADDATYLFYLVAVVSALTHAAGSVSADFRDGSALLWLQKPISPAVHYLGRLGEVVAASLLWLAAAAALLPLASSPRPLSPAPLPPATALPFDPAGHLLVGAAVVVSASAVGFGISALGIRPEALVSLLVVWALGMLGADAATDPALFGGWSPLLAAQRFPVRELQSVWAWSAGLGGPPTPPATLRVLLYPVAWTLLGTVAVTLRASRPTGEAATR